MQSLPSLSVLRYNEKRDRLIEEKEEAGRSIQDNEKVKMKNKKLS